MKKLLHWFLGESFQPESRIALEDSMRALVEVRVLTEVSKLRDYNRRDLEDIRREELRNWKTLSLVLAFLTIFISFVMWFYTRYEMAEQVKEAVDTKMIEPKLREAIDDVIQRHAKDILEKEISPFKLKVDDLHNQLSNMANTITEAETLSRQAQAVTGDLQVQSKVIVPQLESINSAINIMSLIVRADNDDRKAFDELLAQASNEKSPYSDVCSEVVIAISTSSNLKFGVLTSNLNWKSVFNIDAPDKLSIENIKQIMIRTPRADFRSILLQYVWEQNRFSKYDKLDFSAWMINIDPSINNLRNAVEAMDMDSNIREILIRYKDYLSWWDQNKEKYKTGSH